MKEKVLYFIVDGVGNLLDSNYQRLVARDKNINIIQVVAPFGVDTTVYANIDVKASFEKPVSQYIKYSGLKGGDIFKNPLYADFNVFENRLSEVNLTHISRYASGEVGISLSFSSRKKPALAKEYKGEFNLDNELPISANDYEYYVADSGYYNDTFYYDFMLNGINWLKGDIAYWYNGKWRKANHRSLANMSSVDIPVLASVETVELVEEDTPLIIQLAEDIANVESNVGLLETELGVQDNRLNNVELEMPHKLDKRGDTMSGVLNMGGNQIKGLADGTASKDAVTKDQLDYVDGETQRLQTEKADKTYVDAHIEDLNNPHGVTAEQVDTYVKTTIDNKDANVLQEAKDYTYSQVEIDNKDTAIMNKANNLENANMFKDVNYNNVNGVLTFTRYDDTTKEIDLPLELLVESGYYDEVANELVLVLANSSEIRIPVGNLLTDLDAHNIRFNGSGTNYLTAKTEVESSLKKLDQVIKDIDFINIQNQDTSEMQKLRLYVVGGQIGYEIEEE